MSKSGYKAVIFDLDGTILNTIDDISDALNDALKCVGLDTFETNEVKYLVGSGVKVIIEKALRNKLNDKYDELKDKYYDDLFRLYNEKYELCRRNKTRPYAGILEMLKYLNYNDIKICVFSNKPHKDVLPIIDFYFKDIKFDYVLGQTDRNKIKPSIDGIIEIKKALNINDSIMYVGDSEVDILTAKNAKLFSVACSWGFRKKEELQDADVIVDSTYEIIDIIEKAKDNDKVLILNKGMDVSSNKVINNIKYNLNKLGYNINKIGHAGTLDPNATGVLVVLLNEATKISDYLLLNDKEYIADIEIGKLYDSYDIWGNLLEKCDMNDNDYQYIKDNVDEVLKNLIGITNQIPPMYSSIKYHGKKLYDYARKGEFLDLSELNRSIEIFNLERISDVSFDGELVRFKIKCKVSKGTYIRSLAKTIGECLGYPSSMEGLVRSKSGKFSLNDSYNYDDIINGKFKMINMLDCLDEFMQIEASDEMAKDVFNGKHLSLDIDYKLNNEIVIKKNNKLLGIYEFDHFNNNTNKSIYKAKRIWN